ncbi:MAG TPA: hypothetical protein VFC01_27555 [Mycobacterium sp.]|nr:hypothetical protein [Mycobacterium sp.]
MSMNINYEPAASRQFEANPPFFGSKVASITTPGWQKNPVGSHLIMTVGVFAFCGVLGGLYMFMQSSVERSSTSMQQFAGYGFLAVGIALLVLGTAIWYRRSQRKILLSVTTDELTVNIRPGDVYSFIGAKLGTWGVTGGATMGLALHLQSGERRFILGGRDRRVAAGTRLEAEDVGYGLPVDVDAWLSAEDFEEILTMVSRRSGLDIRRPGPGDPIRCLLFVNSLKLQEIGSFSFRKQWEFSRSMHQARLAIDVVPEGIRVIDPQSGALIAAVSTAQVTATPVIYSPEQGNHWFPDLGNVISDVATNYWSTSPGMRVSVPGMAPLTIGCRDSVSGLDFRFSWPGGVPVVAARADYEISGTDLLTLTEKFGLTRHLQRGA